MPTTTLPHASAEPVTTARGYVTDDEYLSGGFPETTQWVDGRVEEMPMITDRHDELTHWFSGTVGVLTQEGGLGVVKGDPFNMKTGPDLPGRSPGVMFIAEAHRHRITRTHLRGPADLVIEVVTPESVRRDKVVKLAEYEAGGVPEYWWVDPEAQGTGFLQLEWGRYCELSPDEHVVDQSGVIPALRLEVAWLWRRPLPRVLDVVRAWGIREPGKI